jgi:hypothetical protein
MWKFPFLMMTNAVFRFSFVLRFLLLCQELFMSSAPNEILRAPSVNFVHHGGFYLTRGGRGIELLGG